MTTTQKLLQRTCWHLLLLVNLFCVGLLAQAAPSASEQTVRVMSYNIRCGSCERADDVNHWSRRKLLVADVIRQSQSDLVGLQEAELFQVQDLVALLPEFEWVGAGRDDGLEKGEMTAVLVRRSAYAIASQQTQWLSPTPHQPSKGWDAALPRTVTVLTLTSRATGRTLHFLNTHFDHMGTQARNASAERIGRMVKAYGQGAAVVLTGDLNAHSDFAGYQSITAVLQDAATVSRTTLIGGGMTFNGFGSDLQPGNKIDYVFVSRALAVQEHRVITDLHNGFYASDHFPVAVELHWSKAPMQ